MSATPTFLASASNAKEKGNEKSRVVDQECVRSRSNALDASPKERDQNCCAKPLNDFRGRKRKYRCRCIFTSHWRYSVMTAKRMILLPERHSLIQINCILTKQDLIESEKTRVVAISGATFGGALAMYQYDDPWKP
jgi:hypothetical protein